MSPFFETPEDEAKQAAVAKLVSQAWNCQCIKFEGRFNPIDWYMVRNDRMVGTGEFKGRDHSSTTYRTVYLSLRKWLPLIMAQTGLSLPAVFVVQFTDCIRWIRAVEVDARNIIIGGRTDRDGVKNDREPIIEVPVSQMRPLTEPKA